MSFQFDRSFFETTPKLFLDLAEGKTLTGTVLIEGGDLSEFTIVMMVCLQRPGMLFSCKLAGPNPANDFTLCCRPNGDINAVQRQASSHQETSTINALSLWGRDLFDGYRHTIGFRCSGDDRDIFIDGDLIDSSKTGGIGDSGLPDDSSNVPVTVTIGGTDPASGSAFAGSLLSAGFWQYQMTAAAIRRASFGFLNGLDLDMLAYWPLDGSLDDVSPNRSNLTLSGPPEGFHPTVQSYWANTPARPFRMSDHGKDFPDYFLFHVDGIAVTAIDPQVRIETDHAINVSSCDLLFGALTGRRQQLSADDSVVVTLTGPDGMRYNNDTQSNLLIVRIRAGGVRAFVVRSPARGKWKLHISAPADQNYTFQVQALPGGGSETVSKARDIALRPLLMGLDDANLDRSRSVATGGGWRWWLWRIGSTAVVGVVAVLTLPADLAVLPLVLTLLVTVARGAQLNAAQQHVKQMDRSDNISACAQTADFIVTHDVKKAILMIDAANRSPTGESGQNADRIYQARQNIVHQILFSDVGLAFDSKFLASTQVTKAAVYGALADPNLVYISATGHGQVDQLLGWLLPNSTSQLETVLDTSVAADLVRGRIFHFLACNIGRAAMPNDPNSPGLARKLYLLGAKAAIGYVSTYDIGTPYTMPMDMCTADGEIDRVLINGGTVAAAVQAARIKYQQIIESYSNQKLKERMTINASMLFFYGDPQAKL